MTLPRPAARRARTWGDDVTPVAPARPGGSSARAPRDYEPARPGGSSARPDMPVRVRIVWDAGIPPPVTRGLEQAERDSFPSLVSPDPGARKVLDVQDADFALSGADGFVVESPALPHIAVGKTADAINVLLVPARLHLFSPVKKISPIYEPEPGSPVRKPGSDFGPAC